MGTGAIPGAVPGGGGASDHGELDGLGDDDHTQYYGPGLREPAIGLEPLRSVTASSQASVDFDQGNIDDTRRVYVIEFTDVHPATDGTTLDLVVSTDGGSSYKTGASDYRYVEHNAKDSSSTGTVGNQGDSVIRVSTFQGGGADEIISGTIRIYQPAEASTETAIATLQHAVDAGGKTRVATIAGRRTNTEANDAVRFKFGSGNIVRGNFDLYGVNTP